MRDTALRTTEELVEKFARNLDSFKKGSYNETQVRLEYINPFFEALGWDIANKEGFAEQYKEVVHEDTVNVRGSTRTPDYSFRLGGQRKFFLEAKKPSVSIKDDKKPAFQLRSYGWSAKLPLSILTDFEEFAVYDTRIEPSASDKVTIGRVDYLHFEEYPDNFDRIYGVFAKESILKGSFDRYVESSKKKRGTADFDDVFLREIEGWRELLAKNIALRNKKLRLDTHQLNFAVQQTIDRIIFLRICEDRGVEDYGRLQALLNGANVYRRLFGLFDRADKLYNSGLFDFIADTLTSTLSIDDKTLKSIIESLYPPKSPYRFSVIGADILGSVYERFLGKVIRLTKSGLAKVEEKPEVKKAGGVYYTPKYIVDYIVENTVGELLKGKTRKKVEKLKILDPACGSGSFLIGAYQCLLDWHLDWYTTNNPAKYAKGKHPAVYKAGKQTWRLTTGEKKRILVNNIYGVDIDRQAVEVTKLSLLLKVLENETEETVGRNFSLFKERVLPNLKDNIRCGNSLIGPDFYSQGTLDMAGLDDDEARRINVFDWNDDEKGFGSIMKEGGFDCVIGNPPYIQLSMADYFNENVCVYLSNNYSSSMGRLNTFGFFIEKTLDAFISKDGYFSLIVPNTILTQESYRHLRQRMLKTTLLGFTTYKYPVFNKAVVETVVFTIQNSTPKNNKISIKECDNSSMTYEAHHIKQNTFINTHNNAFIVTADEKTLKQKNVIDEVGNNLGGIANINQAIALKHDRSLSLFKKKKFDNYKPVIDGRNVQRYSLEWDGNYLAYDVDKIHSCKRRDIFEAAEKIFFRRVGDRLIATYDKKQYFALNTLVVITLKQHDHFSLKYLLGLLNSYLLNFYYKTFLKSTKKVFSEIQARQLAQLPIRTIDFSKKTDKAAHDKMVKLVDAMLSLNKKLAATKTPHERDLTERRIRAIDSQIDALVYELYGLTKEEIRITKDN